MLFGLLRHLFGLAAVLVLLYAFTHVPLGRRTGWEHTVAIFSSEPAKEAAGDLRDATLSTLDRLTHPRPLENDALVDASPAPPHSPSQDALPRGKTAAPGVNHVRSAHQGVPSSP